MAWDSPRHCGKGSVPRTEPCIAAVEEQAAIMGHVNEALRIQGTLNSLRRNETELRALAKQRGSANQEDIEVLEDWRKSMDALEKAERDMRQNFAQAISLTQRYYGVGPKHKTGRIPDGPLKGTLAGWAPAFQDTYRSDAL